MSTLLSDDQFVGGSAGGGSTGGGTLLNDDQFMSGSASSAAPAPKSPAPTDKSSSGFLSDDQFLNGASATKPTESGGFIDQVKKGFISGLIDQNPQMVGNAMEAIAEISAPSGAQRAGEVVGAMVPIKPGGQVRPMEESQQRLRDLANQVKEWGNQGAETRQPNVPSFTSIRTDGLSNMIGDAADYIGYLMGSGIGTSAPSIAAGVAGAAVTKSPLGFIASAAGPSYVQNLGDTYGSMLQNDGVQKAIADGKITRKQVASIAAEAAIPMAALDSVGMEKVIGLNATGLKQAIVGRLVQRVVNGALTEGVTEGVQQVVQEAAIDVAGGDKTLAQQAVSVIDNAIGGAVAGGPMGAASSHAAGSHAQEHAQAAPQVNGQSIPQGATNADTLFGQESASEPPPSSADTAAGGPPPPPAATPAEIEKERPNSPRLTPEDRASPLPNNLIDDGKKIFDEALGGGKKQPTTAADVAPLDGQIITPAQQQEAARRASDIAGEFGPPASQAGAPALEHTIDGTLAPAGPNAAPASSPVRALSDREFIDGISAVDDAAHAAATSPLNALPEPTQAMKEAGNYKVGRARIGGLDVSIENPQGSTRSGVDQTGKPWSQEMQSHYGYLRGTVGKDKDHIDVFVKPGTPPEMADNAPVFVVDQVDPKSGKLDEHKIMMGFGSQAEADAGYHANYQKGWKGAGAVTPTTLGEFKGWLANGDTTKPFAPKPKPSLAELIQKTSEESAARTKQAEGLASAGKPVKMVGQSGRTALVGPDMSEPGKFRITRFDDKGPVGHTVYSDFQSAITDALRERYTPQAKATPQADRPVGAKQRAAPAPTDIIQFLARSGGIQDFKGELRAIDAHKVFVPGAGKLMREKGMPLDRAREAAAQEGFFDAKYGDRDTASEKSTVADLLDLIAETRRGNRQYASGEQGTAASPEKVDRMQEEVEAVAKEHGLQLTDDLTSKILDRIGQGMAVDEAIVDVIEGESLAIDHETEDMKGQGEKALDQEIPFDAKPADAVGEKPSDQGSGRQGPVEGSAREAAPQREQSGSAEPNGSRQEGVKPTVEPGAEGKPQAVIPGAEKISQAEQAQREADKPLRAKAPQKDAGELFDTQARSEKQNDMFSAEPAPQQALKDKIQAKRADAAKIDDFGEKIAGARKDMVRELADSLSSHVDIATEPLSKVFPQPDYARLAEAGVDPRALSFIAVARQQIPAKPRKGYKVARWAEQVRVLRGFANDLLSGRYDPATVREAVLRSSYLRNLSDTAEVINTLDPAMFPDAAKWQVKSGSFSTFMGYKGQPKTFYFLLDEKGRFVKGASGDMVSGTSLEEIIDPARAAISKALEGKKDAASPDRRTKISVYQDRHTKTLFIGFKGQREVIRLKAGFETVKDARSYMEEHADELQATIDAMRAGPQMRRPENRPREGVDRREGDVSPEAFQESFGFRGVQFGNYVEGARRQFELNEAFDGLMDLADVLKVPPQALSLNGTLGLAFGARGHGNAKAHYEPTHVVINLTKTQGAGSLAHEWFHSVDDYFARQDAGGKGVGTDFMTVRNRSDGATRQSVFDAWKGVTKALTGGSYSKRMGELDAARSKPYWGTMIEKAARAFEKYTVDRLASVKATNDYLANIDENAGAYPTDAEMRDQGVTAAFDGLFNAIETRPTERGVELFKLADVQPTDTFKEKAQDVGTRLRTELDRLGLKDVGLRISENLSLMVDGKLHAADGSYFQKLVTVALDAENPDSVLDHEAIHALHDVGAFGKDEWSILERKSRKEWRDRYAIGEAYGSFPDSVQTEEGIAHAYADWRAGRSMDGIIAKAFKKIRGVLQAIGKAFGKDFRSASDVFEQVASGETGNRRTTIAADRMRRVMGDAAANPVDAGGQPMFQSAWNGDSSVNTEDRFKLRKEPETAEDGQKTMQGFIARGQPIDRALRMPFQFFGGVNEKGQWKPGLYLSDKAAHIITTAKIDPEGRFGWLSGPVEAARAGLVDRYGLSPEYIERDRQRHMDERGITMRGAEVLKTLSEQNVGPNEARVLQAILTGEAVTDKDMQQLAEPIRQAIDELGQEAVSLGLVSAESYERNRGSYLHRVYAKHEAEQNNLQKLVSQIMGSKRKKIIGDTLKGRGLFWEVDSARLKQDGKVTQGEKYRVLDKVSAEDNGGKVTSRVYLPADQDVPSKYTGAEWRDNGTWEARQIGKDKVTLWRDYSKAERSKMGEILDARYTIGKTYLHMAHDLATGRFYKDIAENEDWATANEPPDGTWTNPQRFGRASGYGDYQWVRVPDEPIPSTGGKKKWGALSGKYVRTEIWRDLNEIEVMNRPSTWRMLLSQWKLNKTSRSPVTHMNNVMSNLMLMDMNDVRMQDLQAGIRSFLSKDKHWQDANEHGVFGADLMTQEIRDNVLKPILAEIEKQGQDGVQNSFLSRAGILGKFADNLWGLAKTADRKMMDLYRIEDDVFRLASYRAAIARGEHPEHAAAAAREQFLDYDIHAPWVNASRNSLLPFISYTYRAVPLIARSMATHPWKMAKYMMVAYALNALAYAWDDKGDEDKERASLRDDEQGNTWLQTPRMMRMPWRNKDGLPVFLDTRRWIPGGDVFDTNQGSSAVPIPAPLQFGGPLMMAFELALNKSGFTGEAITNDLTDNWFDKTSKVGDYLWKSWMPGAAWVPNSWYWTKIENAIQGATDAKGRPYSVPEAIASSFGVKMKPQDVETGLFWHYKDIKDVETALRAEARTLARQRERGLISQKAFDAGMQSLLDKRDRLVERVKELQRATRKK